MARVRLFANLREIAGTSRIEVDGETVGSVVAAVVEKYGPAFGAGVSHAGVWLNGDPAQAEDAVAPSDEVALIPPVSGGAINVEETPITNVAGIVGSLVVLALANILGSPAWFGAALVGVVSLWVLDLWRETNDGGLNLQLGPIFATVVAAVIAVAGMASLGKGFAGYGIVVIFAIVASLVWAVILEDARHLTILSTSLIVQLVAGLGVASLLLVRIGASGERLIGIFLVQVAVAGLATWLATRFAVPFLDPYVLGAIGAIVAGLMAAWRWEQSELVYFLLEGAVVAMALIAGRGFGALCRIGEVYLVDRPPGILSELDGPLLAAAVFLPILRLVS